MHIYTYINLFIMYTTVSSPSLLAVSHVRPHLLQFAAEWPGVDKHFPQQADEPPETTYHASPARGPYLTDSVSGPIVCSLPVSRRPII